MYLIAVDPGVTTGIALLTSGGELVWSLDCEAPFSELRSALRSYPEAHVVAEDMPAGTPHGKTVFLEVKAVLERYAGDVHWMYPHEWKGHPSARLTDRDLDKTQSKHQREAVAIGRRELANLLPQERAN